MFEEDPLHISGVLSLSVELSSLILSFQILASLVFLNSQFPILKLRCALDSGISIAVPQHGNSLKGSHHVFPMSQGSQSFITCMVSRKTLFYIYCSFLSLFGWMLPPVTPSRSEIGVPRGCFFKSSHAVSVNRRLWEVVQRWWQQVWGCRFEGTWSSCDHKFWCGLSWNGLIWHCVFLHSWSQQPWSCEVKTYSCEGNQWKVRRNQLKFTLLYL